MRRPFRSTAARLALPAPLLGSLALLAAGALPVACNAITGADDLHVGAQGGGGEGGDESSGDGSTTAGPGSGGSASVSTSTSGAGGTAADCSPPCGANEHCEAATGTCVCQPGFVMQGGSCDPAPVGDPTTHTQSEVCQRWTEGHAISEPQPLVASGQECDAGSLKTGAITDTLARINMFRWMAGLGPTTDDAGLDARSQLCANLESFWDFGLPDSPHAPPPGVKCYTADGAATAGESNIAWGSGHPAQAIDQYVQDSGNETTMGHRRWVLNPPLSPVGIGYWQTGGPYGNAQCLRVFGSSGSGPNPPWTAMPPPGFVPAEVAGWTWTFHGSLGGIAGADVSVLRVDDNAPLAVNVTHLLQGYAQDTVSWDPSGWSPEAGKTYRVTVSGLSGGDVVYDVKPVACN